MDIKLSTPKLEFLINKAISHLEKVNKIEIDSHSYSNTYDFEVSTLNRTSNTIIHYTVNFSKDRQKLEFIRVRNSFGNVIYNFTDSEPKKLVNDFTTKFFEKIFEIENVEFKKVFTDYDDTEERNEKLAELLKESEKEAIQTEPEIINNEVPAKKKRWSLFN